MTQGNTLNTCISVTKQAVYTCRYTNEHFIPNSIVQSIDWSRDNFFVLQSLIGLIFNVSAIAPKIIALGNKLMNNVSMGKRDCWSDNVNSILESKQICSLH